MAKNHAGAVFLLISLICSVALLAYWTNYTYDASRRADDSEQKFLESRENLAKAYANMPWTLEQINADIDKNVSAGFYSASDGAWLKNRVAELRNP